MILANARSTFQPTSKTTAYCMSENNEWDSEKKYDEEIPSKWLTDSGCNQPYHRKQNVSPPKTSGIICELHGRFLIVL